MSENQKNKFITWVKTQWSMPGFWPGKAKIIGLAHLGFFILGAILQDPDKKVSSTSNSGVEIVQSESNTKKANLKKLPHSKNERLKVIESISFPDPNNFVDTSEKEIEEHIVKIKELVNNEIKQVVDVYIKSGEEPLTKERDKIIESKQYLEHYELLLKSLYSDPNNKFSKKEEENRDQYLQVYFSAGGTKAKVDNIEKENSLFYRNQKVNKFLISAKKKFLVEIGDIKKDMEEDIKKGSLDEPNYLSILAILVNKQTISFSSKPEDSEMPFLKNIMDNQKMGYSNIPETALYEKEVIEKFREQIDIKPIESLLSIYKGDAEVKKAMELSRVQRERDEKIKNDAEAIKRRGSKPINSGWDNSIPEVCTYLRENLKDPSSVEYTYWSEPLAEGEYWLVKCTYRAKNSLGGYIQRTQIFYIRDGKVVLAR